jgi:hypothetical protein
MAQFGRWDGWHARDIMGVYKTVRADEMGRGVFSEKMVEIWRVLTDKPVSFFYWSVCWFMDSSCDRTKKEKKKWSKYEKNGMPYFFCCEKTGPFHSFKKDSDYMPYSNYCPLQRELFQPRDVFWGW